MPRPLRGRFPAVTSGVSRPEWLAAAAALVILLLAVALSFFQSRPSRRSPAQKLSLTAVRPDAGDQLYDASGSPLRSEIYDGQDLSFWPSNARRREFIFTSDNPNAGRVTAHIEVQPSWKGGTPLGVLTRVYDLPGGRKRLVAQASIPKLSRRRFLFFWHTLRPVEKVDLLLRFYDEASDHTQIRFRGPFAAFPVTAREGVYTLEAVPSEDGTARTVLFRIQFPSGKSPAPGAPVLVFDRRGKVVPVTDRGFKTFSGPSVLQFQARGRALEEIGEVRLLEPQDVVFRNVAIRYPGEPERDHPKALDALAKAMGWTSPPSSWPANPFKGPGQVLESLPLLRGSGLIFAAWNTLSPPGSPQVLDQALTQLKRPEDWNRVQEVAKRWIEAGHPRVRLAGAGLCLAMGSAAGVVTLLDLLESEDVVAQAHASQLLRQYGRLAAEADAVRLADLVLRPTSDPLATRGLLESLAALPLPAAQHQLLRLAQDGRPWIWWDALAVLGPTQLRSLPELPRELQRRAWLVQGTRQPVPDALRQEAAQLLASALTPAWFEDSPSTFFRAYDVMIHTVPVPDATRTLLQFLERLPHPRLRSGLATRLVRQLNQWHRTNLGGLGSDPNPTGPPPVWDAAQWDHVIREARASLAPPAPGSE